VTDPFATSDEAAAYGFPLPGATADGLLARATQALVDAAGFGILTDTATVRLRAAQGMISLRDVPLVTAVTGVDLVHADGTTETVTGWSWPGAVAGVALDVWLGRSAPERHCGVFAVSLTQGLASAPDSLVRLTCAVAYRFAAMPAAMAAGITSQTVGSVSWSASSAPPPSGDLTDGERRQLGRIVPVRTVWPVRP
jgi:hypothetical protein